MSKRDRAVGQRPLERLLSAGPAGLSDEELLAVLLAGRQRAGAAHALAFAVLENCGGLAAVLAASPAELAGIAGLGPARIARLKAAVELGRRYLTEPLARGRALTAPRDAARFFQAHLCDRPHEVFSCIFLDTRHRIIRYEELFRGTIDGATVHPREVVKQALRLDAAAVIVGHNHPSGVAEPSESDRSITLKLAQALGLVEIRLLDHLVVSRGGHVSLAERGWI
jgi:DNA repair protein RadC